MSRLAEHTPADAHDKSLTISELDEAIRGVDASALLVAPRILRRVIKQDAQVTGLGLRVPHRKTYTIERSRLLALVEPAEIDVAAVDELPERLILLARPTAETLAGMTASEALMKYWRLLFHARVHVTCEERIASGHMDDAIVVERLRQIGKSEFEEIRGVLKQEEFLLPPASDRSTYVEFVAVYLELRHFVPNFIASYFPSLEDLSTIDDVVKQDVDGEILLAATRPVGCGESPLASEAHSPDRWFDGPRDQTPAPTRPKRAQRSERKARWFIAQANKAGKMGNVVRAAILHTRATRWAKADVAVEAREQARQELLRLVGRLQLALGFTDNEADEWSRSLHGLVEQSARGFWTAEARMLYDLQKVCVDHERGIYTLDVFRWIGSLGKEPLKRFLPGQRDVLVSKHLRHAAGRLKSAKLSNRSRSRLGALLQGAVHRAEGHLRGRFKPLLVQALDDAHLLPQNLPERVARRKLVDELLDRIVERGYLSMSDLRDALSRNNLKLPDLAGRHEFLYGDQLLQSDRQLGESMDDAYHAGEVYLRWPQRLSSLAFGTTWGRFLTRYVALPFGGAYLLLEALQHLIDLVIHTFTSQPDVHLTRVPTVLALGVLLLLVIQQPSFRLALTQAVISGFRLLKRVFYDWPAQLLRLPVIARLVKSWQFRAFVQYLFKPLLVSSIIGPALSYLFHFHHTWASLAITFVLLNLLLNSRIGRTVDEMLTDWVVLTWHRLRIHVIAALVRMIMDVFNRILETIERLLYTVDEWLRFRAGERRSATIIKAVLGSIWFFVNYFIRFCVNLLIEPQINPIKHFPVVTVSHKILLPLIPTLSAALVAPLGGWAVPVATTVIFLTPGIFGFLVWELKENWRLYAANRPPNLQPVPIGHHGETVLQLLKPGFRSGTIPKLYSRLRQASRKAFWTLNWKSATRQLDGLHHVSTSVQRFVDRELVELLHESRGWGDTTLTSGDIRLGTNRILVELYCPTLAEESLWLGFEEESGWLVAEIHRRGWADRLNPARRHALASALAGFYKMAGVDVVREQVENQLDANSRGYEIEEDSIVIWTNHNHTHRAYPLADWPPTQAVARQRPLYFAGDGRPRWIFAATPISWRRWVLTWELDQLGSAGKHPVIENLNLLPLEATGQMMNGRR